ncbi:MAG: hypothetical protein RL008_130, partial [Actinomycetota bacterium]
DPLFVELFNKTTKNTMPTNNPNPIRNLLSLPKPCLIEFESSATALSEGLDSIEELVVSW